MATPPGGGTAVDGDPWCPAQSQASMLGSGAEIRKDKKGALAFEKDLDKWW